MSSIDCTDTLDLGTLHVKNSGIAVYFPFGNPAYQHDMYDNRIANGNDICFGGGSGEHPCLILGLADAILWVLGAMSTEETFDLLYEATVRNPKEAELLAQLVPYVNDAIPGDTLKDMQEVIYMRIPNFELDMWPLSTWVNARDHFAQVFEVDASDIEFHDVGTVLSCFALHVFPWEYCREQPLLEAYLRVYEILTEREGYHKSPLVKDHVRIQELINSNALLAANDLLEAPVEVTIRFAGKEYPAADFFNKVKTLSTPSPQDNPWGRSLVRDQTGQWQVRWGFNQTMLDAEFEKYLVNPQDDTIPFGLTEFFEAKIRNMT